MASTAKAILDVMKKIQQGQQQRAAREAGAPEKRNSADGALVSGELTSERFGRAVYDKRNGRT